VVRDGWKHVLTLRLGIVINFQSILVVSLPPYAII
jgi:hypothetical protein